MKFSAHMRVVSAGLLALLAGAGCGDTADEPASATTSVSVGSGAGGGGGGSSTSGSGGESTSGSGGESAAHLVLPPVLALPYVIAGQGGSSLTVEVVNDGDLPVTAPDGGPLAWQITGDASLTIVSAPETLEAGASGELTLQFTGAATETIASATVSVETEGGSGQAPAFGVAGDPALGPASWEHVTGVAGADCGDGVTLSMPTAPFPHPSADYADASVRIFVPEGFRERAAQDMIVHFHGFSTTLADTLSAHRYQEHVCASGVDAVLVVPQGPYEDTSGNFGKLMDPGGLSALLHEVLIMLYRESIVTSPVIGDLALTSHSGGYQAVAVNLDTSVNDVPVRQADLFDSIYAYGSTFVDYAEAGGLLRSNYTPFGGTDGDNLAVIDSLESDGFAVATEATQRSLRDAPAVVYAAATTHNGATRLDGAYGEQLRWAMRHHRRGPRIELREATAQGGVATVRWLSPEDDDLVAFRVETSADGASFGVAAEVSPAEDHASFPFSGGARVRVVPVIAGLDEAGALPSDTYRMDDDPDVVVVDGFDRILDGSYGGLEHDFAALVGEAAGKTASVSNEALTEDGFDLSLFPAAVWLLGDESTADHSLSSSEQAIVTAYLEAGGSLVVSGSEAAYDLDGSAAGAAFLGSAFGAAFADDDSGSLSVTGTGPLSGLGGFTFAGPGAPYAEDYPDALSAVGSGAAVLEYGTGMAAGVGIAGRAVLVGFPLELIDGAAKRKSVVAALRSFSGG